MTIVDKDLRNTWVTLIDDQIDGEHVSESLKILSIVAGDPRLHTRTITTPRDIQETAEIIAEGIDDLELSQTRIEKPERLRNLFIRHFIERHIERIERLDLTPEDLYDFEENDSGSDERQNSPTRSEGQQVAIQASQPIYTLEKQKSMSEPEVERVNTEPVEEPNHSSDSLPFHPSDLDLSEIIEDGKVSSEVLDIAERGFDLESSTVDRDYLKENRARLAAILKNADGRDRLFALVALSYVALDTPEAIEPWLSVIEDGMGTYGEISRALALLIYLTIARKDPAAIVGHIDPLMEEMNSLTGYQRTMVFDIIQHVSREKTKQLEGYADHIADGLCDETSRVRQAASVALGLIAKNQPDLIEAYTGLLTKQLEYEDSTGDLAAELLVEIVETNPTAVSPYAEEISSSVTPDARDKKLVRLLKTIQKLLIEDVITDTEVPFDDVMNCLGCEEEIIRGLALTVCNETAKRDPELVQQEMDRIVRCAKDESDQVVQAAALVMSTMAEAQINTVEPFVEDVATLLRTEGENNRSVDIGLKVLCEIAQDRPGTVLPYLDAIVQHLQASDTRRIILASQILGYVSRDDVDTINPYLDQIVHTISNFDDNDNILIPLLDVIQHLVERQPKALDGRLDTIVSQTDHKSPEVASVAAEVCRMVANEDASAVATYLDQLLPLLESGHDGTQRICMHMCRKVTSADSIRIEDRFDWLLNRVRDPDDEITEPMVLVLVGIVKERPGLINDLPHEWYLTHEDRSLRAAATMVLVVAASEYESILINNLESIVDLLGDTDSEYSLAAISACNQLVADYPDIVADHAEAIAEFLDHDGEQHRQAAFDGVEQLARYHDPKVLEPHIDTIIDHWTDDVSSIRRDTALCLGHLGATDKDFIESEFYRLQQLLQDDSPEVSNSAVAAIGKVAEECPDVAQQATEQIIDWLPRENSQAKFGLKTLKRIGVAHSSRLKPHTGTIAKLLLAEDKDNKRLAVHLIGLISQADGEAIVPYLTGLRSAAEESEAVLPMVDILRNVAREAPKEIEEHVDFAVDVVENGKPAEIERALRAIYYLAKESPELVADYADRVTTAFESNAETVAVSGAIVLGTLSDSAPEAVEPHTEKLIDYLEKIEDDDVRLPAVDALYHIAVEFPETVEPHLDVIKSIDADDNTLTSHKRELVRLYEEVSADDEDFNPDPDHGFGQIAIRGQSYDSIKNSGSVKQTKCNSEHEPVSQK